MSFLIDINEELDEQVQAQIRKFRARSKGTDWRMWYRIQVAIARARDKTIYHTDMKNYVLPDLFEGNDNPIEWYYWRDPQQAQVNMINRNLQETSRPSRKRGRVNAFRLRQHMMEILNQRIEEYLNPKPMEKLKILCIIGGSGCGKTLASLHLKYHKDANVICSYTTRPPRDTEVEGRDHHFIDIVPDRDELLAYAHFGGHYYYATKRQVFGPCTVYVIDEKGLANLRLDHGDEYDIYTVLIKREKRLRSKSGVSIARIRRDESRDLRDEDYDYVIENNGKKLNLFQRIEAIYEEVKNKPIRK